MAQKLYRLSAPTDFYPIKQMQLEKFDGQRWAPFGEIIAASDNAPAPAPAAYGARRQA
jgi:hypothetical protein